VTANHTIEASFSPLAYDIDASAEEGGTISPNGTTAVGCGSAQTFTFTADPCHRISGVIVDGFPLGLIPTTYTFSNVTGAHTIDVAFSELGPFAVRAGAGAGGTISPAGESRAACGASLSYAIAPADACHAIQDVKVDGVSQGPIAAYTFENLTTAHAIDAFFSTLGPYTITANAGDGAAITPAGASSVACGASASYAIAPELCRVIRDVTVDGKSVGAVASYAFTDVRGDHTIAATSGPSIALSESHFGASWMTDGAIDLSVAGGMPPYTFAWSNGASSEDLAGLAGGTYGVRVPSLSVNSSGITWANGATTPGTTIPDVIPFVPHRMPLAV